MINKFESLEVDCEWCNFKAVLVCEEGCYAEYCPVCGLDGFGNSSLVEDPRKMLVEKPEGEWLEYVNPDNENDKEKEYLLLVTESSSD